MGKRDWEGGSIYWFSSGVHGGSHKLANQWGVLSARQLLPHVPTNALHQSAPSCFFLAASWETSNRLPITSNKKQYSIVGFLFAHTYLGNCPSNSNTLPATWRRFQNSENRTPKGVNRRWKPSKIKRTIDFKPLNHRCFYNVKLSFLNN